MEARSEVVPTPSVPAPGSGVAGLAVAAPGGARLASPRSERDLRILKSLARRIDPSDAGAHNNLGVVYYHKGLYGEAIEQFEAALDLDPRMQVAQRNLQVAYHHTGYYDEVVRELTARLAVDAGDHEARERLARTYLHGGDPAAAVEEWRRLVESRPQEVSYRLQLARAERERGDLDAALRALEDAAEVDREDAWVQLRLGELHYHRGMSAEARVPLERAVALDPGLAEAHYLLAFVYGDHGDAEAAARSSERALELNPSYAKAEANLSLDRYSAARYQELVGERAPQPEVADAALAHYNLGLALRRKGLFEEAQREFAVALERGEDRLVVRQALAELALLRGGAREAGLLYAALTVEEPSSPKLWNEKGVSAHQTGDLEAAEADYRRALELDPRYALGWNNLGVVCEHRGATAEAERCFRSALEGGRAPAEIWCNLGLLLARRGDAVGAREAYVRAVELQPGRGAGWVGLGAALLELDRAEEARTAFARAVELEPDLAEARYQLAFALSALGDYKGALRETRRALELDPIFPTPRFRLLIDLQFEEAAVLAPELDAPERVRAGTALEEFDFAADALDGVFAQFGRGRVGAASGGLESVRDAVEKGHLDRAALEAARLAAMGHDGPELRLLQGEIFLRRGLAGEALERFDAVVAVTDGDAAGDRDLLGSALLGRARSLLELGRTGPAREAAERLVAVAPGAEAQRVLGRARMAAGESAGAVEAFEAAVRGGGVADATLLADLGAAYWSAGEAGGAESALRRAIGLDGAAVAARTTLGRFLAAEGRLDEAAAELGAALEYLPGYGDAALALAEVELRRGRAGAAIATLADLLTVDPYHLDALARLGEVLAGEGRVADAVIAFRRVLRFVPGHAVAEPGLAALGAGVGAGEGG